MKRILLAIALAAVAVIPWLPTGAAGGTAASGGKAGAASAMAARGSSQHCEVRSVRGFGAIRHFGSSTTVEGPSFLIVDALPLEAQVFLDGRPFGLAAHLMAHAFPLAPGRHTVWVVAPGFKPYSAKFVADPSFSTRLRIALLPE